MSMNDDDFAELFKKLPKRSGGASWQDVAAEIGALGQTVGDVLRTTWQRTESDVVVSQLRQALQGVLDDLNHAAAGSPETQQASEQLVRLTESIREAAARTGDEVRPELLELLRRANAELRRLTQLDS